VSADVYIAIAKDVPNSQIVKLSGTYLCRVFEGPYSQMGKWIKEMTQYVKDKSKQIGKLYFYYTTCPKCAKKYGKNYVVIMAQV
jgi:effector-binding domain-containing protein